MRLSAERIAVAAALAIVAAGCDGRQGLLDPDAGGTTRAASPVLPEDSVLREGVVLRIGVRGYEAGSAVRITALLVDSARNVAWRSAPVETDDGAALVTVAGLPGGVLGKRWLLTAALERDGTRIYAHSDSAGATTLAQAGVRETHVYAGRSIPVGGPVRALVASGLRGEAYFSVHGGGEVGVVDLAGSRLKAPIVADRGEIWDLAVAGGTLGYLADAGSRVRFVGLGGPTLDSAVLGPLEVLVTRSMASVGGEVEVDSVHDVVRPYATGLRLACVDERTVCAEPVALLVSPTQAGGSVVRLLGASAGLPALLVAEHARLPESADTVEASVRVVGPRRPDGVPRTLLERSGVAGCASMQLGLGGLDLSETGSVYSAGGDGCGPAGRIVRINAVLAARPTLSRLGLATMAAEDRIRSPLEVASAGDGSRVLVREADAVWLLDGDLRVLGFEAVSAEARVAWVSPPSGGEVPHFVIADDGRLDVFEADRFGRKGSLPVGPLAGAPFAVVPVPGRGVVAVFVPAGERHSVVTVELGGG
jgi:hypothetical protein